MDREWVGGSRGWVWKCLSTVIFPRSQINQEGQNKRQKNAFSCLQVRGGGSWGRTDCGKGRWKTGGRTVEVVATKAHERSTQAWKGWRNEGCISAHWKIKSRWSKRLRNPKGAMKDHSERKDVDLKWRLLLSGITDRDVGVTENMAIRDRARTHQICQEGKR